MARETRRPSSRPAAHGLPRLLIATFAVLPLSLGRGGEEPIEEVILGDGGAIQQVIEEGETEGIPGIVFLSSGERLRGKVSLTSGNALRIYDVRTRRTYSLELSRISAIRTLVETESIEEAWAFEEEGSRKKIQLGWSYPLRTYRQEVQLQEGQVIEGHCHAAVVYVEHEGRETKLVLPRSQRGKKGQSLDDLVYPASIQLGDLSGETAVGPTRPEELGSLEGTLDGLDAVTLVDRRTLLGYPGVVSKSGAYAVRGLLPGDYLVFLRKGNDITSGVAGETSIPGADLEGIRRRIDASAEFFDRKRVVGALGPRNRPWILVELERRSGTTLQGAEGRSFQFRRWELWALERHGDEWRISSRVFLDRIARPPGASLGVPRYRHDPRLESVKIAERRATLP